LIVRSFTFTRWLDVATVLPTLRLPHVWLQLRCVYGWILHSLRLRFTFTFTLRLPFAAFTYVVTFTVAIFPLRLRLRSVYRCRCFTVYGSGRFVTRFTFYVHAVTGSYGCYHTARWFTFTHGSLLVYAVYAFITPHLRSTVGCLLRTHLHVTHHCSWVLRFTVTFYGLHVWLLLPVTVTPHAFTAHVYTVTFLHGYGSRLRYTFPVGFTRLRLLHTFGYLLHVLRLRYRWFHLHRTFAVLHGLPHTGSLQFTHAVCYLCGSVAVYRTRVCTLHVGLHTFPHTRYYTFTVTVTHTPHVTTTRFTRFADAVTVTVTPPDFTTVCGYGYTAPFTAPLHHTCGLLRLRCLRLLLQFAARCPFGHTVHVYAPLRFAFWLPTVYVRLVGFWFTHHTRLVVLTRYVTGWFYGYRTVTHARLRLRLPPRLGLRLRLPAWLVPVTRLRTPVYRTTAAHTVWLRTHTHGYATVLDFTDFTVHTLLVAHTAFPFTRLHCDYGYVTTGSRLPFTVTFCVWLRLVTHTLRWIFRAPAVACGYAFVARMHVYVLRLHTHTAVLRLLHATHVWVRLLHGFVHGCWFTGSAAFGYGLPAHVYRFTQLHVHGCSYPSLVYTHTFHTRFTCIYVTV